MRRHVKCEVGAKKDVTRDGHGRRGQQGKPDDVEVGCQVVDGQEDVDSYDDKGGERGAYLGVRT